MNSMFLYITISLASWCIAVAIYLYSQKDYQIRLTIVGSQGLLFERKVWLRTYTIMDSNGNSHRFNPPLAICAIPASHCTFQFQWYPRLGVFIQAIGEDCSNAHHAWMIRLNGQWATKGLSTLKLKHNDHLELIYHHTGTRHMINLQTRIGQILQQLRTRVKQLACLFWLVVTGMYALAAIMFVLGIFITPSGTVAFLTEYLFVIELATKVPLILWSLTTMLAGKWFLDNSVGTVPRIIGDTLFRVGLSIVILKLIDIFLFIY